MELSTALLHSTYGSLNPNIACCLPQWTISFKHLMSFSFSNTASYNLPPPPLQCPGFSDVDAYRFVRNQRPLWSNSSVRCVEPRFFIRDVTHIKLLHFVILAQIVPLTNLHPFLQLTKSNYIHVPHSTFAFRCKVTRQTLSPPIRLACVSSETLGASMYICIYTASMTTDENLGWIENSCSWCPILASI